MSRVLAAAILVLVGTISSTSPAEAEDIDPAPTAPLGSIGIGVEPSAAGATTAATPTLLRDGVPVPAGTCTLTEADNPPGDPDPQPVRELNCVGLLDGTYEVAVGGVEAGSYTATSCTDITAARKPAEALPIGNGYDTWFCTTVVGPPSIQILDPAEDPLGTEIRDAGGVLVSDGCDTLAYRFASTRSCQPLPLGSYTTTATLVPADPDSRDVVCSPDDTSEVIDVNGAPVSRGRIELSETHPIWSCFSGTIRPVLSFAIGWLPEGDAPPPSDWLDSLTVVLVDTSDASVKVTCVVTRVIDVDAGRRFASGSCPDVPDGTYQLDVTGVPVDLFVRDECRIIVVYEFAGGADCSIDVSNQALVSFDDPPVDPVLPNDPVLDGPTLPETGSTDSRWLVLGTLLIAVGLGMMSAGRRRRLT